MCWFVQLHSPIFSPGRLKMLFGDISEPLPHGYILTAPAKWPGFSRIEATFATDKPTASGYVRSLEVDGPLVLGAYNWRYDSSPDKDTQANQGYFAFDTRSGRVLDFGTLAELNRYAGHPLHLLETRYFRSPDTSRKRLLNLDRAIVFGPPLACALIYFVYLLWRLAEEPSSCRRRAPVGV